MDFSKTSHSAVKLSRKIVPIHVFFCLFLFYSVKRPFQDYFTHIETSQSVDGTKREYPGKTTRHIRKQN